MFVLKDKRQKSGEALGQYYVNKFKHLIPTDVELWEYDEMTMDAEQIY